MIPQPNVDDRVKDIVSKIPSHIRIEVPMITIENEAIKMVDNGEELKCLIGRLENLVVSR